MVPFSFPADLVFLGAGPEEAKNHSGEKILRLIQIRLATAQFGKIPTVCQRRNVGSRPTNVRALRRCFVINGSFHTARVGAGHSDCWFFLGAIYPNRAPPLDLSI